MRNHVIIAHGMSELDLFRGILAWTGQDAVVFSRSNGRNNMAISHLDRMLREFVTPVLNYPNMEATMDAIGYDVEGIDKGDFYKNLVRGLRRRDDILGFYGKLRDCDCTNMEVVLFHMLERHPDYQDVLEPPRTKDWAMLRNL